MASLNAIQEIRSVAQGLELTPHLLRQRQTADADNGSLSDGGIGIAQSLKKGWNGTRRSWGIHLERVPSPCVSALETFQESSRVVRFSEIHPVINDPTARDQEK